MIGLHLVRARRHLGPEGWARDPLEQVPGADHSPDFLGREEKPVPPAVVPELQKEGGGRDASGGHR